MRYIYFLQRAREPKGDSAVGKVVYATHNCLGTAPSALPLALDVF